MKSLSTALTERAMAKREMPADPLADYRASAATQVPGVVDAAMFTRQSSEIARDVAGSASLGGPLARFALKKIEKKRAGGLPEHFLLAITADEVVALERTYTSGTRVASGEPGPEVGRWRRADLDVTAKDKGHLLHVRLDPRGDGETINCSTVKIDATAAFVAAI